jgi:valyl-tRNA synthetase
MPYVTEEVWSWRFAGAGRGRSVHTAPWPEPGELAAVPPAPADGTFEAAVEVMTKVRGAKTLAQKSLRWPVAKLAITGPEAARAALQPVLDDILRAGNVAAGGLELHDGAAPENERFAISVILGENDV